MKKSIDKLRFYEYNSTCIDEAWLSLVERCVRDAEVVGSNPVASTTHRKSETNWFSGFLFAILVVMQQQKGKEKLTDQERFMKEAIRQAKKARALEEVPIGCVIVYQDKIIARGYNRRTIDKNTLAHAELQAIRKASKKMEDWRLEECTMYVTLEPCQMCSGAIVQSRMTRVVVGCMNPKAGCAGSILNLLQMPQFNHQVELTTGVLEEECSQMMCTNNIFSCVVRRTRSNERYPGSKLNPGTLTAPERFHLVLLRSRPDTVHRVPPRKTQISTPQTRGSFDK